MASVRTHVFDLIMSGIILILYHLFACPTLSSSHFLRTPPFESWPVTIIPGPLLGDHLAGVWINKISLSCFWRSSLNRLPCSVAEHYAPRRWIIGPCILVFGSSRIV